ncbi:MAG TPA: 4-(cytidine 5'-diphospho)-2-C-methyl-D-erythritol kinase [Desulfobulbaceae bacterium]|nr:4-(cytidine 5'-diphospho)-2-C-methyl-D-erythritol kinase [Desulfobulbaceae bacterium]
MPTTEQTLELDAPAKINLYLRVTGRRADGYHYLATLMQKISLFDRVLLRRIDSGIRVHCPDSSLPEDEGNLVYRAACLFLQTMAPRLYGSLGVEVTLKKNIPLAAGLGGGSSDAAAVLVGMDQLFATGCSEAELLTMGSRLGADVPLFIVDWPAAWATGIGDRLRPAVPLAGYRVVLVNPGFSVETGWVYENFALTAVGKKINLKNFDDQQADDAGCPFIRRAIRPGELVNELEAVTAGKFQEIYSLRQRLLKGGAVAAMMTGSGPSVFGLFTGQEEEKAVACGRELSREFPKTFLVSPLTS